MAVAVRDITGVLRQIRVFLILKAAEIPNRVRPRIRIIVIPKVLAVVRAGIGVCLQAAGFRTVRHP